MSTLKLTRRVAPEVRRGFMCKIDFDCELEHALGGNKVYPSLRDLKENHTCWESCGVVEVEVRLARVVHPDKYP